MNKNQLIVRASFLKRITAKLASKNKLFSLILLTSLLILPAGNSIGQKTFNFEQVVAKAQKLMEQPYNPKAGLIPKFLLDIKYDAWRDIRFRPTRALWRNENLPFNVQFFHPGLYFPRAVTINVIEPNGMTKKVPFSTEFFEYEKMAAPLKKKIPANLGFAGFRLHYPINTPTYLDEVIVFLGASYFRAVAQYSNYGLSARGISINTVGSTPEEFPYFTEFWLVKPTPGSKEITIYALLDGESVTGAYQFVVRPGKDTQVDVNATIFLRKEVERLGLAPLTSMFFFGENTNFRPINDFRPEVHDSDGLQIALGSGEWLWRPLKNPRAITNNWFFTTNPQGFGLIQRDRDFDHYQDLEAHYEKRPSVWITPKGEWGEGWIVLLQIPSNKEFDDNINTLWVPAKPPVPKQPFHFAYTMSWHYPDNTRPPGGKVVATRTADGKTKQSQKFIIDFAGGKLEAIPAEKPLTAIISADPRAQIVEYQLQKNIITNGWRLVFEVKVENEELLQKVLQGTAPAIELRAFLKDGEEVLTETWSYAIQP